MRWSFFEFAIRTDVLEVAQPGARGLLHEHVAVLPQRRFDRGRRLMRLDGESAILGRNALSISR